MNKISEFDIASENPKDHWDDLDVAGKNVLDLGCGRWDANSFEETTPYFFINKGASSVVGIDVVKEEVDFFKSKQLTNCTFIECSVRDKDTLLKLIADHKIDVIKMDIEGNEVILKDIEMKDFQNISSIAVEYHLNVDKNLLVETLANLGFKNYKHGKLWVNGMGVIFATR